MPNNTDNHGSNGLGGTSYLYDFGTSPNTRVAVSQKVRLLTPHYGNNSALHQMGVLSTFSPTMSRTIDNIRGIGFGDKVAELVPGVTEPITGSFERALVYLCNLWQAAGYAAGVDGPVRSLAHHRWPFDMEQQMVMSSLADRDMSVENIGWPGKSGSFDGGVKPVSFPQVTPNSATGGHPGSNRGHSAIITIYEACWFSGWNTTFSKDQGFIMESGDITVTDVHDFASVYGEFLATGNDPTIGQLGSIRFRESGFKIPEAGSGIGGGVQSSFVQ